MTRDNPNSTVISLEDHRSARMLDRLIKSSGQPAWVVEAALWKAIKRIEDDREKR